jgi:hypothetical protein
MDGDRLDRVHPDVLDVTFLNALDNTNDGGGGQAGGGGNQTGGGGGITDVIVDPEGDGIPSWPWVILSFGIVTICLFVFLFGRRRRRREEEQESQDDDQDGLIPTHIVHSGNRQIHEKDMSSVVPLSENDPADDVDLQGAAVHTRSLGSGMYRPCIPARWAAVCTAMN